METKKSAQANLEKQRPLFFQIGLIFALSVTFIAFEWSSTFKVESIAGKGENVRIWEFDYVPDIKIEVPDVKQPEEKPAKVSRELPPKIVPDEIEIPDKREKDVVVKKPVVPVMIPAIVDSLPPGPMELWRLEKMPEFPGGMTACYEWLKKNTNYPAYEKENRIHEKIIVRFVVDEDGKVVDVEAIGRNTALVKEAERVVSQMPAWSPGMMGTKKVKAIFSLPIVFKTK